MKIRTKNGNWHIDGINLISSDSIYQKLVTAIEAGELDEQHLQKKIGHQAPIRVNRKNNRIQFCAW